MSTASGQGPDLSRIVSLIMQNPDLIRQIEALAKENSESTGEETAKDLQDSDFAEEKEEKTQAVSAAVQPNSRDRREKRTHLLSALRPYVSEKRGKTIDTLLGAMDLWDLIGGG